MAYSEKYKRILNRLGYYDYQQGLIFRHLNQGEGWNTHLLNCRNFILKSLTIFKPSTVTILGNGWLLDLPLKEIAEQIDCVNLIDIVHPPEAAKQVSSIKNVILTEADVTGGLIEEVWEKAGKLPFYRKLKTLNDIVVPSFELPGEKGLVISPNILRQLETLPLKILKARSSAGENEFLKLRGEIQKKHLDFLSSHNSVLITDTSEIFTDKTGKETEMKSIIINLPEGESREEWTWDFDLRRSDYYEKNSVLKVVALLAGVILFLLLVRLYAGYSEKADFNGKLAAINRYEFNALSGDWSEFDPAENMINPAHEFSNDIDLFGKESLFQYLNRTFTGYGKEILTGWLENPYQTSAQKFYVTSKPI